MEVNTIYEPTPAPKGARKITKVGMSLSGSLEKNTMRAKISVQSTIVKANPTAIQNSDIKNPTSGIT